MGDSTKMILAVALTTICWVLAAFFGPRTDEKVLFDFVKKINPAGFGWNKVRQLAADKGVDLTVEGVRPVNLGKGILLSLVSCICIYALLVGIGDAIFVRWGNFAVQAALALVSGAITYWLWKKRDGNH